MHHSNLTALEIQTAHKNEHQHIIEIKEHWLNAYDRGEMYNLRDAYENTLGFNNGDKLEAWQAQALEKLKSKPAHFSARLYLQSLGESSDFSFSIERRLISVIYSYEIKRKQSNDFVEIFKTDKSFVFEIRTSDIVHTLFYDFEAEVLHLKSGSAEKRQITCPLSEFGLFEILFEGISQAKVDKNLLSQLLIVFHDFVDKTGTSLEAFEKFPLSDAEVSK